MTREALTPRAVRHAIGIDLGGTKIAAGRSGRTQLVRSRFRMPPPQRELARPGAAHRVHNRSQGDD